MIKPHLVQVDMKTTRVELKISYHFLLDRIILSIRIHKKK